MEAFDEELYEDRPELSQPIARCAECGELIYDNSSEIYVDGDNNYFCCCDCSLNFYGIHQPECVL